MERSELIKLIDTTDIDNIMSFNSNQMFFLTDNYDEELVRRIIAKGNDNIQQRQLFRRIDDLFSIRYEEHDTYGNTYLQNGIEYPKYMEDLDLLLACGTTVSWAKENVLLCDINNPTTTLSIDDYNRLIDTISSSSSDLTRTLAEVLERFRLVQEKLKNDIEKTYKTQLNNKEKQLQDANSLIADVKQKLEDQEKDLQQYRLDIKDMQAKVNRAKNERDEMEKKLKDYAGNANSPYLLQVENETLLAKLHEYEKKFNDSFYDFVTYENVITEIAKTDSKEDRNKYITFFRILLPKMNTTDFKRDINRKRKEIEEEEEQHNSDKTVINIQTLNNSGTITGDVKDPKYER